MNLAMRLDLAADAVADRVAVKCKDQSLTYVELCHAARAAAKLMQAARCKHAALLDTNKLAAPVVLFGAAYWGSALCSMERGGRCGGRRRAEQWGRGGDRPPAASAIEQELKDRVRERLRSSRVPGHIAFRRGLPYSDTGKLMRCIVRAEFQTNI